MRTIGSIVKLQNGLGPGFDFVRVALALSVVFLHGENVATGNNYFMSRGLWFPEYAVLVCFFSLSGFLITGSATRLNIFNFMVNRGLRIFPALAVEIILSAFLIGPLFTQLPISQYLLNGQTYHYLTNIIGIINYQLPGVFKHNPKTYINSSLWTVPCELGCYLIMGLLMLGNLLRRKIVVISITTVLIIIGFIVPHLYDSVSSTSPLDQLIFATFADRGAKLYVAFLLGIAAYLYRDRLPYSWWLFGGCVAFCLGLSAMRPAPWMTVPLLNLIVAPVTVYMTVFIGATRIPRLPIYGRGDYSYGIYLYGVPIQQSVRAALPFTDTALLNLLFSIPLITLFAMFSWHCIEKPILRLRKRFSFVARVRGVEGPGESKVGAPSPGA